MRSRAWVLALAAVMVVGPVAPALGGSAVVDGEPAGSVSDATGQASGPLAAAQQGVGQWSQAVPSDSRADALARLADAGLAFAGDDDVQRGEPGAVLEALGPLVEAHGEATSELVPGVDAGAGQRSEQIDRVQRILDAAEDGPMTASQALELAREPNGNLEMERWIDTGQRTLGAVQGYQSARGSDNVDPAEQTQQPLPLDGMPDPEHEVPEAPSFGSLREAVEALYAFYDHEATPAEEEDLSDFERLPDATAKALTRIVEAHVLQARATEIFLTDAPQQVFADRDRNDITNLTEELDLGLLAHANRQAHAMIAPLVDDLICQANGPQSQTGMFQYDLACQDSTYTQDASLLVDLGGDDVYRNNAGGGNVGAGLLVDRAGDDAYRADETFSGGLNGGGSLGLGFLLDGSGNDTYETIRTNDLGDVLVGVNGGGVGGSGVLVDFAGNDAYRVGLVQNGSGRLDAGVNGGGRAGSGVLVDVTGDDAYTARLVQNGTDTLDAGVNGGGSVGSAVVVDGAGNDTYRARLIQKGSGELFAGVNGGANEGSGVVVDQTGDDAYTARLVHKGNTPDDDLYGGVNGGGRLGSGVLVDGAGNDAYRARLIHEGNSTEGDLLTGTNGGGRGGSGVLVDRGGDDVYEARLGQNGTGDLEGGLNGGGILGSGALVDRAGNDRYGVHLVDDGTGELLGGVNGGAWGGSGVLVDGAGNDRYRARLIQNGTGANEDLQAGVNGGAENGALGVLVDGAGNDAYTARLVHNGTGPFDDLFAGVNGAAKVGFGSLLDAAGANRFEVAVESEERASVAANGAAAGSPVLLAATGAPVALSGDGSSVPASWTGGLGLLLGGPGDDTYESNGTTQGAADQYGLGILVDPGGNNTYTAGPGAGSGLAQGAGQHGGLGLLVDDGHRATFTMNGTVDGQGLGQQGVGLLAHTNPEATSAYRQADPPASILSDGAGAGLLVDAGTVQTPLTIPSCRTPVFASAGGFDVCLPDEENTSRPIIHPLTGEPVGEVSQPPVPCSSLGVGPVQCEAIVTTLLGEEAVEFLEMDSHEARTSGALDLVVLGQEANAGFTAEGRGVMPSYDHSCHASCHTLKQIAHAT